LYVPSSFCHKLKGFEKSDFGGAQDQIALKCKTPTAKASKIESQLCPNYKRGVGQAFGCNIHHFSEQSKIGFTHHYHHKKKKGKL
jgi:hypothetical protein